jgi:hypothetical protein
MAESSGCVCSLIPNESELEKELVEMHRKWGQPVWKGLTLKGQDEPFKSPKFWDVWQDIPTTFFGRFKELPETSKVSGWLEGGEWYDRELPVLQTEDPVVYRSWARSRLLDLEDLFLVNKASPAELVKLSVSAQVLCRFTAFSAVDKAEKVDTSQEMSRIAQPVEQTIARSKQRAIGAKPMLGMMSRSPGNSPPMLRSMSFQPPSPAPSVSSDALFECAEVEASSEPFMDCSLDMALEDSDDLFSAEPGGGGKFSPIAPSPQRGWQPPAPGGTSLKSYFKSLLQQDPFLNLGLSPSSEAVDQCLKVITQMVDELTEKLRENAFSGNQEDDWKAILAKLLDYKEALEQVTDTLETKAARGLRKELAKLLDALN